MTQIVAYIDHDRLCLVADRRGSAYTSQGYKPLSDKLCKLVSICGQSVIAYTGLAELAGRPMDEWIAIQLAKSNCTSHRRAADVLRVRASEAFKCFSNKPYQHAFVLIGWVKRASDNWITSEIVLVTNALDNQLNWKKKPEREFFTLTFQLPQDREFHMTSFGVRLPVPTRIDANKKLSELRCGASASEAIPRYLSSLILGTHRAHPDLTVGAQTLSVVIPKAALSQPNRGSLIGSMKSVGLASFASFDPRYNEFFQEGPTFVCGNMATTGVVGENSRDGTMQSAEVKILHRPK